jgi:tetratricopeptide (TPR) repeat protein
MESSQRWNELTSRVAALYQHGSQGWYLEAARSAEEALSFAETEFGADHPNTAESLESLALIRHAQGKYVERLLVEQELAEGKAHALLPDDPTFRYPLNHQVLSNLTKRKYSEAESLFKQALSIKDTIYPHDHPDVLRSIGNLAELYTSQGKHEEAESLLSSIRMQHIGAIEDSQITRPEIKDKRPSRGPLLRQDPRFRGQFPTEIAIGGVGGPSFRGRTENISEHGALIKFEDWRACRINDQVTLTIFVPSPFFEQDENVGMQGVGLVTRIDEENEGVAVEFAKSFAQFERIEELDVAGNIRYRKLAYYLSFLAELPFAQFEENHPNGFLVERVQSILDGDVIFQFSTQQVDDGDSFYQLDKSAFQTELLQARVIEIKKRKIKPASDIITIGRSANNDIIIYNRMVSKSHCHLYTSSPGEACYLVDIGSTNGTYINNNKIEPHEKDTLNDADEISFGLETKLIYFSAKAMHKILSELRLSE